MHRWLGAEATGSVGLKASQFQLTDGERQLRDQAYPVIEPPHSRPAWKAVFGDYQVVASPWRQKVAFDRTAYGRQLIDEPHRSDASRYSQLIDDVRDDITRFEPFYTTAARVLDLDRKRNASLAHVSQLSPRERADAVARMEENTLIVQWVQQCQERRISSYRWALERLVVQAPDNIAAEADRLINELAALAANPPVAIQPVTGTGSVRAAETIPKIMRRAQRLAGIGSVCTLQLDAASEACACGIRPGSGASAFITINPAVLGESMISRSAAVTSSSSGNAAC